MFAAFETIMETSSCGLETIIMPSSGIVWKTVSGTSPVPGGQSTSRRSMSFQMTSVQNCFTVPGDDRSAPYDGAPLIVEQQVDRHYVDTRLGARRDKTVLVARNIGMNAESLGDRGAGNIGIKYTDMVAAALHKHGGHAGNERLTDAALAADNTDYFFYRAESIRLLMKILRRTLAFEGQFAEQLEQSCVHSDILFIKPFPADRAVCVFFLR